MKVNVKALDWAIYWIDCYECPNSCPSGNCNDCKQKTAARKEITRIIEEAQR